MAKVSKQQIIEVAIRLFAENGFNHTSYQAIAREIGCSQPAIVYHFKKKENLIEGALACVVQTSQAFVDQGMKPTFNARKRIEVYFERNLLWATTSINEAQIVSLLFYLSSFNETFRNHYALMQKLARERIEGILLAGIREGVFNKSLRVGLWSELLHDIVLGGIVNAVTEIDNPELIMKTQKKWKQLWKSLDWVN